MTKTLLASTLALVVFLAMGSAHGAVRIASWNTLHLGYNNDKDYAQVAAVVSRFDLVGLQEVMDRPAIEQLVATLEQQTGQDWNSTMSHEVGRSSYKEAYAFVWRTSAIEHKQGDATYLDPGDRFAREPFSSVFSDRASGQAFVMGIVHIVFGDSQADRRPEIRELDRYWAWLNESYRMPVILAGDFNTPPGDPAWRELRTDAEPLITRGATTIGTTPGEYVSLYDNIWVEAGRLNVSSAGIADFPSWLGLSNTAARDHVSDHLPVYMTLGSVRVDSGQVRRQAKAEKGSRKATPTASRSNCIDINTASAEALDRLDHVGPAYAQKIIAGRPWRSLSELSQISGISNGYVDDIRAGGQTCAF